MVRFGRVVRDGCRGGVVPGLLLSLTHGPCRLESQLHPMCDGAWIGPRQAKVKLRPSDPCADTGLGGFQEAKSLTAPWMVFFILSQFTLQSIEGIGSASAWAK